jgi:hypothetical protein
VKLPTAAELRGIPIKSKTALVVPDHKQVDPGTLIEIIRQAGLKRDEFIKLLK